MHLSNQHSDQAAGSIIGMIMGVAKSLTAETQLSWPLIKQTIVLAAIGAFVGFLVTTISKLVKRKIFKS